MNYSPAAVFGCAVSLGAQNFDWFLRSRAHRAGTAGVEVTQTKLYTLDLEAFGPSRAALDEALARYLSTYPEKSFRTSFESEPRCIAGEWIARGSRNREAGWW